MRALTVILALAATVATAGAQTTAQTTAPAAASDSAPPAQRADGPGATILRTKLSLLRLFSDRAIPATASFVNGAYTVPAGADVDSTVAVSSGTLDVLGRVHGDAIAVDGDIRIRAGAEVTGDAIAFGGRVINEGGTVGGDVLSLDGIGRAAVLGPAQPLGLLGRLKLVAGWFAVLAIIGVGVLVFAERNLDGVVLALERGVARSFFVGLLGQVALLPALLILSLALAVTVIGLLLVPFAIVAYVVAVAGLVTLGFLAVVRLTGGVAVRPEGTANARGQAVRALAFGLAFYLVLWLAAAALASQPVLGGVLRLLAIATTWVAATAGLGATLLSRAGTSRTVKGGAASTADDLSWQTPTPVTGVAAARRPAPRAKQPG